MNELWNARRVKLEGEVIRACLDLLKHMGSAAAFEMPLDPPYEDFVVIAGKREDLQRSHMTSGHP